MMETDLYI